MNFLFQSQGVRSIYDLSFEINYLDKDDKEFVQLVARLPWTHNIILIEKVKNKNIRKWYIEKCIKEGWSKSILIYQIDTNLYLRQVKNIKHNNFDLVLKKDSDLASNIMKDPYIFDIIELTENYKEKELENKMLERLKNVLLELGSGFIIPEISADETGLTKYEEVYDLKPKIRKLTKNQL